ncbi:stage V sporulation protein AE [Rossellomorea vietnamensis]|uniref:Stage V sporulation protein AE n=1 Tax=Rossellomorea vietnamensis TaxID=218284 RepID=A0A5D4MFW6_9BACI|nr:stage V sporulation protein AE [Rossellomorea vietnamensis]TYS00603.1 stage V sporulation protein AE [Rossellomorea vietnamensis]
MAEKKNVIIVTDGDEYARRAIEAAAKEYGARCISRSQGNPSVLKGSEIAGLIKKAKGDLVFVMFDDSGFLGEGSGETAMKYVAGCREFNILGAIAVASKTRQAEWTRVDVCVDKFGELTPYGVDKFGVPENEIGRLNGDTVYCLDQLKLPIVVGIGDIGKMAKRDDFSRGAPITKKAVEIILERSGYHAK